MATLTLLATFAFDGQRVTAEVGRTTARSRAPPPPPPSSPPPRARIIACDISCEDGKARRRRPEETPPHARARVCSCEARLVSDMVERVVSYFLAFEARTIAYVLRAPPPAAKPRTI